MKEINGVIKEDIIVTDNDGGLKLGSEVRFEGGVIRYTGTGTLNVYGGGVIDNKDDVNDGITYGEGGTNIVAGDYQIFYGNAFAFKGKWSIKGIAYASWFGLENTADWGVEWVVKNDSEGSDDSGSLIRVDMLKDNSVPINTAIRLKGQGEVKLPMGKYGISHHISMPEGIQLIGVGSDIDGMVMGTILFPFVNTNTDTNYTYRSSYEIAVSTMNENKINLSNIPFPLPTDGFDSSDTSLLAREFGYMIVINIQDEIAVSVDSTGKVITYFHNVSKNDNRHRSTVVANIDLSYKGDDNYNHQYKGILFEGGVEFYNVRSYGLVQFCGNAGIMYSDDRVVRNCCFGLNDLTDYDTITTKLYAFDLKGLGDAMLFMGNHAASYHPKIGSLRIDSCKGGVIEGNILNSDIMINRSNGVTFNGNHCEYGIKLDVRGSSVSICDNIFWKGAHATIRIRRLQSPITVYQQAVTLRNNTFYYYMRAGALAGAHNINSTCEYDVATDGWSNIVIENCFRSRFYDEVNEFSPTGIKVGLLKMYEADTYYWDVNEVSDLPEFNNYSHINSLQSVISGQRVSFGGNKGLCLGSPLSSISILLSEIAASSSIYKRYYSKQGSTVQYTVYDMYDVERDLGKKIIESQSITLNQPNSLININLPENLYSISRVKMLKVVRLLDGVYSSVCIPLCGAAVLTDDGSNINGYPWVEFSSLLKIDPQEASSLNYKGDNIECTMTERPISGTWMDGDVVWVGSLTLVRYERRGVYWYKVTTTTGS